MNTNTSNALPVFYTCPICGNLAEMIQSSGRPMICCGKEMLRLDSGTTDGATEAHVPVCEVDDRKIYVQVGSKLHPMTPEHHIAWVELVTDCGIQRKPVYPKEKPCVHFTLGKHEVPLAVYGYCNIHKLWVTKQFKG